MDYAWKILDIEAADGIIKSAKYYCSATQDDLTVETEGNWYFRDPEGKVTAYDQVTENQVIGWINQEAIRDGKNLITSRLDEQIEALKNKKPVVAPWLPQVFTPEI